MEVRSVDKYGYESCLGLAAKYILNGKIVCFPTETFYALGVRYDDENCLKRLSDLKGRPESKAFSLIIGSKSELSLLVSDIDPLDEVVTDRLWAAALTVVFKAGENLSSFIMDENNTVAVRIPAHSFALDLAMKIGTPVTATSANRSGMQPSRSPDQVVKYFPCGIDLLIDGGVCDSEKPSTIISLENGNIKILREGVVGSAELYNAVNDYIK